MKTNVVQLRRTDDCLVKPDSRNLPPRRLRNSAVRSREYLTENEVARLMEGAKDIGGRRVTRGSFLDANNGG